MPHYYFDIRDGQDLYPDEEGLELADQRAAEIEAAMSLAGMAKDQPPLDERKYMAIEVRTLDWTNLFSRRPSFLNSPD